jgi:hypothetical protein
MPHEIERAQQCDLLSPGEIETLSTDDTTARKPKRKFGNVWLEGGHYLFRSGHNGGTVFDTWKWFGEPLRRKGGR